MQSAQEFDNLIAQLNPSQREAVEHTEGPVMVIAGPGTGKTQILAARILNILRLTDANPSEILCLTYTEAGATAMRERLARFMGAEAYRVHIYTFHGLGNKVIQENPELFSMRELRVMDDLEKIDLLDALIRKQAANSPVKDYNENPDNLRKRIGKLFDLMEKENYSAADLEAWVQKLSDPENYKAAFPGDVYKRKYKEFPPGEIKQGSLKKALSDWQKLLAAARMHEAYNERKRELGVYEFSDMLHWVLKAFNERPELLMSYQERFQYVLVDEYQDTSGIQNELLYKLISFWDDNPNCFVVGDPDQSIYAFQGARPENMQEFERRYATNLHKVHLKDNYRSSPAILSAAHALIANNPDHSGTTLLPAGPNKELTTQVQLREYLNAYHEAVDICDQIRGLVDSGMPAENIAVLYSQHKISAEIQDVLKAENVPYSLVRSIDILQEPLILNLLDWITYLAHELDFPHSGEHLLYRLMHFKPYGIPAFEVARMASEIHKHNYRWRDDIKQRLSKAPKADLFQSGPPLDGLGRLWQHMEEWLHEAVHLNLPQLIQLLMNKGGFLVQAWDSPEKEWNLEMLHSFLDFAETVNARKPFISLQEFVEIVERMKENKLAIPLEKRIGSDKGVQLSSAHGSKGMEYDAVFLVGAELANWEKDSSRSLPFGAKKLFEGLLVLDQKIKASEEESSGDDKLDEKRRLFYVAMTRARKQLQISWSSKKIDAQGTETPPSRFVLEVAGIPESLQDKVRVEPGKAAGIEKKVLENLYLPRLVQTDTEWLRDKVKEFKFSPSSLYAVFDCGLRFYYNYLIRMPSAGNPNMAYGNAVHGSLYKWVNLGMTKKTWFSAKELVKAFETEMYFGRREFSRDSYELRLQQGRDLLPDYHGARSEIFQAYKEIIGEKWLEAFVDGVMIGGYSDKLIFEGNDVTIVDYKTGNPNSIAKKVKGPTEKAITAGKLPNNYWFQLGMYHLIVNEQPGKKWNAIKGQIDIVMKNDDGQFDTLDLYYNSEDLELLRTYIRDGKRRLDNLEFLTGCGKEDCEYCNFSKTQKLVSFVSDEE